MYGRSTNWHKRDLQKELFTSLAENISEQKDFQRLFNKDFFKIQGISKDINLLFSLIKKATQGKPKLLQDIRSFKIAKAIKYESDSGKSMDELEAFLSCISEITKCLKASLKISHQNICIK